MSIKNQVVLHPERCVAIIRGDWHNSQCQRPNGHGPEGKYCKQHAPADPEQATPWFAVTSGTRITQKLMVEVSESYLAEPGRKTKVKKSGYENWFRTREEAVEFVLRRLTISVDGYRRRLAEAEEELQKFIEQEKQ